MSGKWTPFGAKIVHGDTTVTVIVWGEIDAGTAPELRETLCHAFEGGRDVAIDMAQVDFLDSTGLAEVIGALTILAGDGRRLVVTAVSPAVARLLEIAGLNDKLQVCEGDGQTPEQ